jgi:hypothetical protein
MNRSIINEETCRHKSTGFSQEVRKINLDNYTLKINYDFQRSYFRNIHNNCWSHFTCNYELKISK